MRLEAHDEAIEPTARLATGITVDSLRVPGLQFMVWVSSLEFTAFGARDKQTNAQHSLSVVTVMRGFES